MSFSECLKKIRVSRKITQKKLAEMIGVSPNSISNYENKVSFPDEETLRMLFIALECKPDDLFQVATFQFQQKANSCSPTVTRITEKLPKLTDDQLESVEKRIDTYIEDNEMKERDVMAGKNKKAT